MNTTTTATRNAATLYADIMRAAMVAPDESGRPTRKGIEAWEARIERASVYLRDQDFQSWSAQSDCAQIAAQDEADSELMRYQEAQPSHVTFKTATGRIKLENRRARLEAFAADMLKGGWTLWGGGPKPTEAIKPKAARATWKAATVSLVAQTLEDKDHAGALALAETQAGGRVYQIKGGGFLTWAPMPVDGLPACFVSGRHQGMAGRWIVWHMQTGQILRAGLPERRPGFATRAKAEESARECLAGMITGRLAEIERMTATTTPEEARADWVREYCPELAQAEQLASMQAQAQAMAQAAIQKAQEPATATHQAQELTHEAQELATCGAGSIADSATTQAQAIRHGTSADGIVTAGTPSHATPSHATHGHATATSTRAGTTPAHLMPCHDKNPPIQHIKDKAGTWSAEMWTDAEGSKMLKFSTGQGETLQACNTAQERLKIFSSLAKQADEAQKQARAGGMPQGDAPSPANPGGMGPTDGNSGQQFAPVPYAADKDPQDLGAPDPAEFEMAKPANVDLRQLMAMGMQLANFVGLGVRYSGDMANEPGAGAITQAKPCNFYGLSLQVTLEDGRQWLCGPREFAQSPGVRLSIDWKHHGAPYLAQLAAAVATLKASKSAQEQHHKQTHAQELERLAAEFPQLQRAEPGRNGGKLAAVNVRILLKAAFKGVKFSVTSDYSTLNIKWTGGPSVAAVDEVVGRFDIGASDAQSDYFYTVRTAWSELFGGVQYMFTHRTTTDDEVKAALVAIFGADGPSLEDWKTQKAWSQVKHGKQPAMGDEWHWLTMVRRYLNGQPD